MIRDEEIERLVNYIRGLGLKVSFSSKKSDCSAFWYLDNSEIVICKNSNSTKIDTVLSLIHEAGHALHNIHERDRQEDTKYAEALDHIDQAEEQGIDAQKKQRKIVLDNEIAGSLYWDVIYKDTNMQFPLWRLEVAKEHDIWQYEVFYETGKDPTAKERRKKLKERTARYRKKNG